MTLGITILPQGSISTKSRRKGLKRSKEGLATATTEKLDMMAVKPPMLPQENAISQPSEESARAHIRVGSTRSIFHNISLPIIYIFDDI